MSAGALGCPRTVEVHSTVLADARRVWGTLSDFSTYTAWNPAFHIEGAAEPSAAVRVRWGRLSLRAVITTCEGPSRLAWRYVGGGRLLTCEQAFDLQSVAAGRARLVQRMHLGGLVSSVLPGMALRRLATTLNAMNRALVEHLEAPACSGTAEKRALRLVGAPSRARSPGEAPDPP